MGGDKELKDFVEFYIFRKSESTKHMNYRALLALLSGEDEPEPGEGEEEDEYEDEEFKADDEEELKEDEEAQKHLHKELLNEPSPKLSDEEEDQTQQLILDLGEQFFRKIAQALTQRSTSTRTYWERFFQNVIVDNGEKEV